MSGGHYDYNYYQLNYLADNIETDFINDGKYIDEDLNADIGWNHKRPEIESDRLNDATKEQKVIILKEIKQLIIDLRACSERSRELDLLLSSDTSPDSYIEQMKEKGHL